jgi:hypothetical protein
MAANDLRYGLGESDVSASLPLMVSLKIININKKIKN